LLTESACLFARAAHSAAKHARIAAIAACLPSHGDDARAPGAATARRRTSGLSAACSPGAGPPERGQEEQWTVKVYVRRAAPGAARGLASPGLAERRVLLARGSRRCRVDRVGHGVEPAQARARGHERHRARPRVRCMRWVVQLTRRSRRGPHPLCAREFLRRYSSCKVPHRASVHTRDAGLGNGCSSAPLSTRVD